ncbi:MAG: SpoIIE family protein phosphatase [Bacteroidia bacterium]|nr:SpoIIE family protein phosphatase [Bacteroidia bacterium]
MSKSISFASRIGRYIITAASILFLTSMLVISLIAFYFGKRQAVENSSNVLNKVISDVNGILTTVETAVNSNVWVIQDHLDDPDFMYDITANLVKSTDLIIGSAVAFEANHYPEKGEYFSPYSYQYEIGSEILSKQLGSNDYDYFTADWYQLPLLLKKSGWSEPYFDEGGGDQMMTTYSAPVEDGDGNVIAIMTADVNLNTLTDKITSLKLYENSQNVMIGNSGAFLIHWNPDRLLNSTVFSTALEMESDKVFNIGSRMIAKESGSSNFKAEDGKHSFISYGSLSNGWSVGVISAYSDVFAYTKLLNIFMLVAMLLGLGLLYYLINRLIKKHTQPITEFTYSAMAIAKGNFKARIPEIQTNDELKRLQESLSYMEKSIDNYISELRSTTAVNEKMGQELTIASNIQMHMLSTDFPELDNLDLFATLHPAKEVGGDLYDFYVQDNKLYFIVGDVSGKGVPAALFMAITRSAFRYIIKSGYDMATVISRINNSFSEGNDSNMFVTLFAGCVDLETYEMDYCNAGHNPIIIVSPDQHAEYLHAKANLAAGLFEGFPYSGEKIQIKKGSRIIIYTDGVSEAENSRKDLFGEDRLIEYAAKFPAKDSSSEFIEGLIGSIKQFTSGNEQNDDITVMSIVLK